MRSLAQSFWCLSVALLFAALSHGAAESIEEVFEAASNEIKGVSYWDVLHDRQPRNGAESLEDWERLQKVLDREASFEELEALLKHPKGRVRTLALIALFRLEKREVIPLVFRMMSDEGETFPREQHLSTLGGVKLERRLTDQTVAHVASLMLGMVGYSPRLKDQQLDTESFEQWQEDCLMNPHWLGWYEFLEKRASAGTVPIPAMCTPRILRLRHMIEQLEAPMRYWVLLHLRAEQIGLASDDEIGMALRELGPDALLQYLEDGSRRGLNAKNEKDENPTRYAITRRAELIFEAKHSSALAELGFLIAAADANPERAVEILKSAIENEFIGSGKGGDRARALAALVAHGGDSVSDYVVEKFYGDPSLGGGGNEQSSFTYELAFRKPKEWRATLKGIVAHPRFEFYPPLQLGYLEGTISGFAEGALPWDNGMRAYVRRNRLREFFGLKEVDYRFLGDEGPVVSKPEWEYEPAEQLGALENFTVSRSGELVALGFRRGTVVVLDAMTGNVLWRDEISKKKVSVAFAGDQDRLYGFGTKSRIFRWDGRAGRRLGPLRLQDKDHASPSISRDGAHLIADGEELSVHSSVTGRLLWRHERPASAHKGEAVSADGRRVLYGSYYGKVPELWDTKDRRCIGRLEGHATNSTGNIERVWSDDGTILATTARNDRLVVWSGVTGEKLKEFHSTSPYFRAFSLSADGKMLAGNSGFWGLGVFDLESGEKLGAFELPHRMSKDPIFGRDVHLSPRGAAFGRDGSVYASFGRQHTLVIAKMKIPDRK